MPIYEYHCNKCGRNFEQLIFRSEIEENFICPECGDGDTCRLLSSFSCGSGGSEGALSSELSSGCSPSSGGFS
ncbi:zinc ribbon domain-containing protein [Thermodesulfobacteriota bacterium]